MLLSLKNIVPHHLEKEKVANSAVWNKTIDITKGNRIQLVAPSGSGKTSLMHFIYGLRSDYDGDVLFENESLKNIHPTKLAAIRANKMSVIFQDLRLFNEFTVYENIAIKKQLSPFAEAMPIEAMAAALGIQNKLSQKAGTCSYGEQQRVAIIRALQQPFDMIIMDEPFSHLDEANSIKAMQLIEHAAEQRGATIILADLEPISFFKAHQQIHL
ncbi:ATP-binding cassette domain-containing protein [Ferruginibacter yonginensis]|uniref:ATP-binding cassette domain-containing protein n=1 Tax=Ferruginibacter yonginensis TaxID=1310416 RepID=A0ABV8QQ25_9BACT